VVGRLADQDTWDGVFLFPSGSVLIGTVWIVSWYMWTRYRLHEGRLAW
jgi:hypothetical protein